MKQSMARSGMHTVLVAALVAGCAGAGDTSEEHVGLLSEELCTALTVVSDDSDYLAVPGQAVTWTATGTCSGTPQYRFNLRDPSGVWVVAQDWSTSNTYAWNTTGLALGNYNMQVWARDAAAPLLKYDRYNGRGFTLASSNPCSSASTTIAPSAGALGANFTFNNTAATCISPEFAIYQKPPGGVFQLLSPYSAANAGYVWNSTGALTGTHTFQVWARKPGSTKAWEAIAASKNVIVSAAGPCAAAGLTLSPTTHAPVGTNVTLTASSSTCSTPTYKYFMRPPGGAFQVLQDWTSSSTVQWNTQLAPEGIHTLQIYVRNAGSTASYEAFVTKTYTLDAVSPTSVVAVGGGWQTNCELLASGKVACWGYNGHGELGVGAVYPKSTTPLPVSGLTQGISLGVGNNHACAVVLGGTVRCWGQNNSGQLGNGTITDSATPVTVSGIASAVSVSAGTSHTCAVLADGSVRCWGYNSQGQLGDGTLANRSVPVTVAGLSNAVQVSTGYYHSCARLRSGAVSCWGYNAAGQLGNGSTTNSLVPVTVSNLAGVTTISTASSNNCALSTGAIWCWGANSPQGSLGNGTTTTATTPVQVTGVTNAASVAVNGYHGCASLQTGQVTCWGWNTYGQLGDATNTNSASPVPVSTIANATSVGISTYASCATLNDNTTQCWGYGNQGTLGNGSTANSNIPVVVAAVP